MEAKVGTTMASEPVRYPRVLGNGSGALLGNHGDVWPAVNNCSWPFILLIMLSVHFVTCSCAM